MLEDILDQSIREELLQRLEQDPISDSPVAQSRWSWAMIAAMSFRLWELSCLCFGRGS